MELMGFPAPQGAGIFFAQAAAEIIPELVQREDNYVGAGRSMWTKWPRPTTPGRMKRTFRVYQDNARKFKHNVELTRSRQRRLEEAGVFRAPPMPKGRCGPRTAQRPC